MEQKKFRIAVIGNYLPRKCGLATFTTDISEALAAEFGDQAVMAVAINDRPEGYDYPDRVAYEIPQDDLAAYRRAAEFLNVQGTDIVLLEHEFGIFGGLDGSHILTTLEQLRVPIVTTLHTILRHPTPGQREVTKRLVALSDRLIVMSERGATFLKEIYGAPPDKIDFVHHGIPDVPFVDPDVNKECFGLSGKTVLLTFGLLSPNKGVEYVIDALPSILAHYPDVVYVVLGATHPKLVELEQESYRTRLMEQAQSLGVDDHVVFLNQFVTLEELCKYIGASDIYITPYLNETQITSGTLAYATGAGKAVISTPYWYAQELLADGRGLLIPFRSAAAIATSVLRLLGNPTEFNTFRRNTYALGRTMVWEQSARRHRACFEKAKAARRTHVPMVSSGKTRTAYSHEVPVASFEHLLRMVDDTGLLQHAKYSVPNYSEGYCTDDNARALMLMVYAGELAENDDRLLRTLSGRFLAFLQHAFNESTGRFRNFMSYDRRWLEECGSEDSHGRALWALGIVTAQTNDRSLRHLAAGLVQRAAPATEKFTSPRAWAFSTLGMLEYMRRYDGDRTMRQRALLHAERLLKALDVCSDDDWVWFEDILAYSNARLPHALLAAGRRFDREDLEAAGLRSLEWLTRQQRMITDHFVPIGSDGFYPREGRRARFDQQPVEAHCAIGACLEAYRVTREDRWLEEARVAFEWFLGRNDLGLPMYDSVTGGCFDGLTPYGVNENQGAESTLAFLLSRAEMRLHLPSESFVPESEETWPTDSRLSTPLHNKETHGDVIAKSS